MQGARILPFGILESESILGPNGLHAVKAIDQVNLNCLQKHPLSVDFSYLEFSRNVVKKLYIAMLFLALHFNQFRKRMSVKMKIISLRSGSLKVYRFFEIGSLTEAHAEPAISEVLVI